MHPETFPRGLKYVSKNRKERIDGIAHELANSNHDIIALQELWVFADYENVQERVSKQLPHSKFFYRYRRAVTHLFRNSRVAW